MWKAAALPSVEPGAGPPLLLATLREPVERVGLAATLPAQGTRGDDVITCMPRVGGEGKDSHPSYGLAVHTRVAIR